MYHILNKLDTKKVKYMNVVLLSGGSGTRLWPLSNDVRSKQFLKIFKTADGHESMAMRMLRMIKEADPDAKITIATSENQVSQIKDQLGDEVGISIEPMRRDTFPAIALACAYLADHGVKREEPVVICPVDPYVEEDYFRMLKDLSDEAKKGTANLTLMGVEPTYPSTKYGYIIPKSTDEIAFVKEFKEKPTREKAEAFIKEGALWNGGVFAFKLGYVLDISNSLLGTDDFKKLSEEYANLKKISFDYAVVENEKDIAVMRFNGAWKDLGTWNTFTEAMSDEKSGNSILAECDNTHVVNELSLPLITLGINNAVVVATPDGVLVADKDKSDKLKDYVEKQRPMYEKRVWGEYKVLDYCKHDDGNNSLTKHLIIKAGEHISYQRHKFRTEIWTFTEGSGELIINGQITKISRGDTAVITAGMKHAIKADDNTDLHVIEVQLGDELTEEDIERLDYNWNAK